MPERGFLLLSASAQGAGPVLSGYDAVNGMLWWNHTALSASANSGSASAQIFGSVHPDMGWFPITSLNVGGGGRGSAILSGNYGHLMASATWISASGVLTMFAGWAY